MVSLSQFLGLGAQNSHKREKTGNISSLPQQNLISNNVDNI